MTFQVDLKPTLRGLVRAPGFLVGAVLCLALGLGANAILFNAARALLWRPLAFRDADRVVSSFTRISNEKRYEQLSLGHAALLRDRTEAFSEVGLAQMMPEPIIVHPETDGPTFGAGTVNLDYLKALSLQPLQGRFFTEEEMRQGAPVALLTETAWRTSFGADPGILGRAVPTLSMGRPGYLRIIGVVPGGATLPFLSAAQLLLPGHWMAASDGTYDGNLTPKSVLRLKPGVGLAQANAAVQNTFQVAEGAWPATVRGTRLELEHLRAVLAPVNPKAVLLLYSAAALLLMLTCANVASLFRYLRRRS